jgi:DNA invertase Pin-like site-specific DNA recombinase
MNRPELDKLRDLASQDGIDVVVIHDIDRLARDPAIFATLELEFEDLGVEVHYVLNRYADTPEGQLMKDMKAAFARFENLQRVERSRRGARRKVKEGKVIVGPHRPYGYEVTPDGRLEIIENEIEVVKSIFAMLVHDGLTLCQIVECLEGTPTKNDKTGVYPKKRRYGQWSRSSVRYVLTNELYVGRWHYGKHRSTGRKGRRGDKAQFDYVLCDPQPRETWLEVQVPPIISQETFDAAQEMLDCNRRMARRNRKHDYFLSGLIFCECGRAMTGASYNTDGKTYSYYVCTARTEYTMAGPRCTARRLRVDAVDEAVWEHIYNLLMHPQNLLVGLEAEQEKQREAQEKLGQNLNRIDRLIEECDRKLERLLDSALTEQFEVGLVSAKAQQLKEERKGLLAERANIQARLAGSFVTETTIQGVQEFAERVAVGLETIDFEAKRQLLKLLGIRVDCEMFPSEDGRRAVVSGYIPTFEVVTTKDRRSYSSNCRQSRRRCPARSGTAASSRSGWPTGWRLRRRST